VDTRKTIRRLNKDGYTRWQRSSLGPLSHPSVKRRHGNRLTSTLKTSPGIVYSADILMSSTWRVATASM
jgi:hypothetical protein